MADKRTSERPRAKPPLRSVRCAECAHGWVLARVCMLAPLSEWPGEKPMGCMYYERRKDGTK